MTMSRGHDYQDRPPSEQLSDLHIYVVPPDLWREHLNSAVNQIVNDTVSAGFIRVHPEMTVYSLREEIETQLGVDTTPRDYYFLKSVGRCLTRVKPKQEYQIKVKHFLPPLAYSPEIYVLEATPEVRALFPQSGTSSESSSYRNSSTSRSDKSDFNPFKPIPPIKNGYNSTPLTGDSQLPPLSATPPLSPEASHQQNTHHQPEREGGDFLPPLSATSPTSPGETRSPQRKRVDHLINNDSGISDSDDLERRRMEELKRKREEEQQRLEDDRLREEEELQLQQRLREEERRRQQEKEQLEQCQRQWEEEEKRRQEERQRLEEERHRWEEEQQQQEEEEQRLREEEEQRRRKEEEERRKAQERQRREEERRQQERIPSPPRAPIQADNKEELLAELEAARQERLAMEKKREELVKRAKHLQSKTSSRRNQARDMWKKKYFEEKKKTPMFEDQSNKLRQELESLHRRIMSQLETTKEKENKKLDHHKPSSHSNLKIATTKFQHDIDDLNRKIENIKMKLTSEMKLRNQAETELRALRAELTQKKISVTLSRSQQLQALGSSQDIYSPRAQAALPSQR